MGDGTSLNRQAYEKLIAEDLAWLDGMPLTLERTHIQLIVRLSPDREFSGIAALRAEVAELKLELAREQESEWSCGGCGYTSVDKHRLPGVDQERLDHAEASLAILREAAGALVESLPKCDHCEKPATRAYKRGAARYCDESEGVPEYPRAVPLRALVALLFGAESQPSPLTTERVEAMRKALELFARSLDDHFIASGSGITFGHLRAAKAALE